MTTRTFKQHFVATSATFQCRFQWFFEQSENRLHAQKALLIEMLA